MKILQSRNKYLVLSFLFFFLAYANYGQAAKDSNLRLNLQQQATKMGRFLIAGDYKAFAAYTYPKLLNMIGGRDKMAALPTKTINDMLAEGMTFSKVTFGEPSKFSKSGNELQSIIPQHTEIKLRQGKIVTTSTLIAISNDNGSNWTFVDTSNKEMSAIRKLLPNLSSAIVIPPQQPPVRYDY